MAARRDVEEEVSFTEAAKRLGMTPTGIALLIDAGQGKDPPPPVTHKGARRVCRWPAFPKWYRQQLLQSRQKPENIAEAEQRIAIADAELKELKLQRERGEVVLVDLFRETVSKITSTVRAQLLAVPGRYAARTAGKASLIESQAAWDAAVRDILNDLRDGDGTR